MFVTPRSAFGLALFLLCLPLLAHAQAPAAVPSAAYHWHSLKLKHILPTVAAATLHWDTPTATLPTGVERIYVIQSNASLLLRATDAGLAEATRLVQTVDLADAAQPAPSQVRLQVSFISVSKTDIDNLGVIFEPAPYSPAGGQPEPQVIQLRTATGNIAVQLYQTLTRVRHLLLSVPEVVTSDTVTAKFVEDTEIPNILPQTTSSPFGAPPAERKMRRLQTSFSITPRINADGSVTLVFVPLDGDLNAPPKALTVPTAKTVASGQVLALSGLPFGKDKPTDDQELLVFVTPTVLNADGSPVIPKPNPAAAPVVDTGQPDPPMPGITDTPAEAQKRVTVDVYNADLPTVAGMLRRQIGADITLRLGDTPFRPVSVHLDQATPARVLRAVARSAGATLTRDRQGGYVFAMPAAPAAPEAVPNVGAAPFRPLVPDTYRLHSIRLKHVRASDLIAKMHWNAEAASPFSPLETIPLPRRYPLPAGVRQVFAVGESNTLFAEATDSGFAAIMQTVNALDSGPQPVEFHTLLLAVPTSRRGLDPADKDATDFLKTLLSGARRLVWAVPVTAEGGQEMSVGVAVGGHPVPPGFRLSAHRNADGTLTLHPAFDGWSPLPARTVSVGKAAVGEVPNQPLKTGERLFFFVRPTLLPAAADTGQSVTIVP